MVPKIVNIARFIKFSFRFLKEQFVLNKQARETGIVRNIQNVQLGPKASIDPTVDIIVQGSEPHEKVIFLGQNSWVRKYVELNSSNGSKIVIKDYSTIQDFCKLIGDITIERYCLFSCNIFISSGNHNAFYKPYKLIREQDKEVQRTGSIARTSRPVHVEEDCWIGWGAFIKQGIYIGRGSVIGAYAVVTKDVMPYSVVAGQPAQTIKRRLNFSPPHTVDGSCDEHLPYFYRGFGQLEYHLTKSRQFDCIGALGTAYMVLSGNTQARKVIIDLCNICNATSQVKISSNCFQSKSLELKGMSNLISIDVNPNPEFLTEEYFPEYLHSFMLIKIESANQIQMNTSDFLFGVKQVKLEPI
jgi:acetyltransferase-like isoleucine patch superfamily enzyme